MYSQAVSEAATLLKSRALMIALWTFSRTDIELDSDTAAAFVNICTGEVPADADRLPK
jgi:hypothetical protein